MKRNLSNSRPGVSASRKATTQSSAPVSVRKPARARQQPRLARFERVLVPVDFSETSQQAFESSLLFAQKFGAKITLLHVVEPVVYPVDYLIVPPEMEDATIAITRETKKRLAALQEETRVATGVEVATLTRTGRPYHEIIEAAKSLKSDLIVLGTHGYTGLKKFYLGSTAERVMRHAPCPVLVVRAMEHGKKGKR
jgi:universal stress protein A